MRYLLLSALLFTSSALAEQKPLWEAGAGIGYIDFPDYRGSDERTSYFLPIPFFIYRGEFIQVNRDSVRGQLFESERLELDISLNGSVPVDSDDNDARRGMDDLDPTIEVGPELEIHLLQDTERGYTVDLRLPLRTVISSEIEQIGWIAQPALNLDIVAPQRFPGWRLGLQTSLLFGDREYHDYFYGVDKAFATPSRPAYSADGGYAGAQAVAALSKRFPRYWVGGFVKWDTLDGAVFDDSPLVRKDSHFTAGLAMSWIFRVSETLVDIEGHRDPG